MSKQFLLGEVKAAGDDDGKGPGEFEVILSAPTLDRDGEVVDSKIFEPLPDHITFDIDHGMSVATTVASGVPSYDDEGRLRVKGTYSSIPRAQEVRTLVREGHIRTTSVAFMGAKREEKDGVQHVVSAELLNGAFVPIPSNRESVVLSAKAYAEATEHPVPDAGRLRPAAVARKGHGMTANDLRQVVTNAVQEAHGSTSERRYIWLRDYSDDYAVFEVYEAGVETLYQQTYTVEGRSATMTGDPSEVTARTVYDPVRPPNSSTDVAPGTAATRSAGPAAKSPASAVARARLAAVRASLPAGL